tara:strand:+ start:2098 stop:2499 length:402 start_codon:yes stop_codon:yes gene_type:complete
MRSRWVLNVVASLVPFLMVGCSNSLDSDEAAVIFNEHNDLYTYNLVAEALERGDPSAARDAVRKRNFLKQAIKISDCDAVDGRGPDAESFDYVKCVATLPATKLSPESASELLFSRAKDSESWVFLKTVAKPQ